MDPLDAEIKIKHLRRNAEILKENRLELLARNRFYLARMCEVIGDVCIDLADVMEAVYFPQEPT